MNEDVRGAENKHNLQNKNNFLKSLLEIEKSISKTAESTIIYPPPLISLNGIPIITRGTINMIQGRQGSHKSRFAEYLASLLICPEDRKTTSSLGFTKVEDEELTVCYVDTERNFQQEFPSAIQNIVSTAGFSNLSEVSNFRFTSLKNVVRAQRLEALKQFITSVKETTVNPLFVVLDVVSDCTASFNDLPETLKLFDYIGKLIEELNTTFLLVIHENPSTDKARGHLGTESINKSATAMHIGFEKVGNNETSQLLQLKFVKQRHSKLLPPIALTFSEETKSLELADPALVKSIADQRRSKASVNDIAAALTKYLKPKLEQKELLAYLNSDFQCSPNTMKTRLEEVESKYISINNEHGATCNLKIISTSGKPTVYELSEIHKIDLVE